MPPSPGHGPLKMLGRMLIPRGIILRPVLKSLIKRSLHRIKYDVKVRTAPQQANASSSMTRTTPSNALSNHLSTIRAIHRGVRSSSSAGTNQGSAASSSHSRTRFGRRLRYPTHAGPSLRSRSFMTTSPAFAAARPSARSSSSWASSILSRLRSRTAQTPLSDLVERVGASLRGAGIVGRGSGSSGGGGGGSGGGAGRSWAYEYLPLRGQTSGGGGGRAGQAWQRRLDLQHRRRGDSSQYSTLSVQARLAHRVATRHPDAGLPPVMSTGIFGHGQASNVHKLFGALTREAMEAAGRSGGGARGVSANALRGLGRWGLAGGLMLVGGGGVGVGSTSDDDVDIAAEKARTVVQGDDVVVAVPVVMQVLARKLFEHEQVEKSSTHMPSNSIPSLDAQLSRGPSAIHSALRKIDVTKRDGRSRWDRPSSRPMKSRRQYSAIEKHLVECRRQRFKREVERYFPRPPTSSRTSGSHDRATASQVVTHLLVPLAPSIAHLLSASSTSLGGGGVGSDELSAEEASSSSSPPIDLQHAVPDLLRNVWPIHQRFDTHTSHKVMPLLNRLANAGLLDVDPDVDREDSSPAARRIDIIFGPPSTTPSSAGQLEPEALRFTFPHLSAAELRRILGVESMSRAERHRRGQWWHIHEERLLLPVVNEEVRDGDALVGTPIESPYNGRTAEDDDDVSTFATESILDGSVSVDSDSHADTDMDGRYEESLSSSLLVGSQVAAWRMPRLDDAGRVVSTSATENDDDDDGQDCEFEYEYEYEYEVMAVEPGMEEADVWAEQQSSAAAGRAEPRNPAQGSRPSGGHVGGGGGSSTSNRTSTFYGSDLDNDEEEETSEMEVSLVDSSLLLRSRNAAAGDSTTTNVSSPLSPLAMSSSISSGASVWAA